MAYMINKILLLYYSCDVSIKPVFFCYVYNDLLYLFNSIFISTKPFDENSNMFHVGLFFKHSPFLYEGNGY